MSEVERQLADYYDAEGAERADRELMPERIAARTSFLAGHATRGMHSLEIGTGPGRDAQAFVEAGLVAHGIDLSPVFASLATKAGAHLATATARGLPFREATFDIVWSMSVLMHIPDDGISDALDEIRRVLRTGGVACLGVWGKDDQARVLDGKFGPRFFANRSEATWRDLVASIGELEQYEVWTADEEDFAYHWAVIRRTI